MSLNEALLIGLASILISSVLTGLVRRWAIRWNVVDRPESAPDRKIHQRAIPLLGGVALYLSFVIVSAAMAFGADWFLDGYLLPKHLLGVWLGGLVIVVGGVLDDRFNLGPKRQIIFPLIAVCVVIASGIGVEYISNPVGEPISLTQWNWEIFRLGGLPYGLTLFADLFALIWLMGMMYTTKFLDGLDGLATGVTSIGAIVIFCLSLVPAVGQPETAALALIFAGTGIGFLVWNFHPAKIFLGEAGSVWVGFFLGTLSIISGAKIATALLIMGIPILDVVWVIIRRGVFEHRSIVSSDRKHLHFRLLDIGFSHRRAVLFLYSLTALFGLAGLFLSGRWKLYGLVAVAAVMLVLAIVLIRSYRRK